MKLFRTESGSLYEVDEGAKRIRRVEGKHHQDRPLRRDKVWERYSSYSTKNYGDRLVVCLEGYDDPVEGPMVVITSPIVGEDSRPSSPGS